MGNVDMAVEYLMSGIPDDAAMSDARDEESEEMGGEGGEGALSQLREHPQFDELRRTIQVNPGSLQAVLQQIGSENPHLLALIQSNQQEFLAMMNEPVQPAQATAAGTMMGADGDGADLDAAGFARAMASIPPQQRAQLAATIGLTPEQFEQFAQQMQSMPSDQLRQLLSAFAGGGEGGHQGGPMGGGAGGGMGGGGGRGGGGGHQGNVVRLTRDEADAVSRLAELGFSRDDAVQAYLACDKNEALAANLLFDGFESNVSGFAPPPVHAPATAPQDAPTDAPPAQDAPGAPPTAPSPDDDDDMYS